MIDIIHIEPTNRCLLNCDCCGDKKVRPEGYMTPTEFACILSGLSEINKDAAIRLFLSGDPLLHPRLPTFCDIAYNFGFRDLVIHTSGYILTEELAGLLIQNHLPKISFSIDKFHKPASEKEHEVSWKIVKNIKVWLRVNGEHGSTVHTTIQALVTSNEEEKHLRKLFKQEFPTANNLLLKRPHNWDEMGSVKGAATKRFGQRCKFTVRRAAIYWDGSAAVCCADLNGKLILGNILKGDTLRSIAKKVDLIGRDMKAGIPLPAGAPCLTCERYLRRRANG